MSICRVVLASGSPRRHQLLNLIGIVHEVNPANIDETLRPREAPRRHAERLAREKASTIAVRDPDLITIGAYKPGQNPRVDRAVQHIDNLNRFLKQKPGDKAALMDSWRLLKAILTQQAPQAQVQPQPGAS